MATSLKAELVLSLIRVMITLLVPLGWLNLEKNHVRVWFDPEGDLLEVELGKPRKVFFRDVGDDVFLRVDEKEKLLVLPS